MNEADRLQDLYYGWRSCTHCGLCEKRKHVVFGEGNPTADILIIGEAPGKKEDQTGLPFQGEAGDVLNDFLSTTGLSRDDDVFITNVVGCRPTAEVKDDRTGKTITTNRPPSKAERDACRDRLMEIIYIVDPLLIIAVGNVPATALLGRASTMQKMRGRIFKATIPGIRTRIHYPVLVVYHTAYLLRTFDTREEGPWGNTLRDFYAACDVIDYLREAYYGTPIPDRRSGDKQSDPR